MNVYCARMCINVYTRIYEYAAVYAWCIYIYMCWYILSYYIIFYQQHPQAGISDHDSSGKVALEVLINTFCDTKIFHKFSWENDFRYWYACIAANKQWEGLDFPALGAAQILAHWSEVAECLSAQGRGLKEFSICRAEAGDTSILWVYVFSFCWRFCTHFSLWLMSGGVRNNPETHCRMKMHEAYLIIFVWRCDTCDVPQTFILKSNTSFGRFGFFRRRPSTCIKKFWAGQTGRLKRQAIPPPLYSEFIPCMLQHTAEPKQEKENLYYLIFIEGILVQTIFWMAFASWKPLLWRSELL